MKLLTSRWKKERKDTFKILKEKEMPNEILYSVKMSLKNEDEVIMFLDQERIFQQTCTKINRLKRNVQTEGKWSQNLTCNCRLK